MPKLHIDDTDFEFTIVQYEKNPEWRWSKIRVGIHNYYLNFEDCSEYLHKWEVDLIIQKLHDLLDGVMLEEFEMWGIEPDIGLKFRPATSDCGGYLDFSFNFRTESGAYSNEVWTITLDYSDIRNLLGGLEYEKVHGGE